MCHPNIESAATALSDCHSFVSTTTFQASESAVALSM